MPSFINYRVTSVQGTYSGDGMEVVSSTRTDTLAKNTCAHSSPGTTATQQAFIGLSDWTRYLPIVGTTTCPAGMATSTAAASCTTAPVNIAGRLGVDVSLSGWADDSVVTFKIRYAPTAIPGCNYAAVLATGANEWVMQASTTVSRFRASIQFPLRFVGARMLSTTNASSEVSWDFTLIVQPL